MSRSRVVFPDPDGPRRVKNSPARTARSTPATASTSPYFFRRPVTRTAAAAAAGSPAAAGCAELGTAITRLVVPRFSRPPQWSSCLALRAPGDAAVEPAGAVALGQCRVDGAP